MTSVEEFTEYNIIGYKKRTWNVPSFLHNGLNDLNYTEIQRTS